MGKRLISIAFIVFFFASSVVFYAIAVGIWLLTAPFDRRLTWLHLFTSFWGSVYTWVMPFWSVTVEGRENMRKGATYVIVSNHQSMLDVLVAYRLFYPFRWVSKAEIFRIPFIGWNMVLNRYIRLKRGDRRSVRDMLVACEKALAEGSSVYIFPEGTRSETGTLRPFKSGAFLLAKRQKVPILPIVIFGTKDTLPKHSLIIRGNHKIRIRVLEEIPYERIADLTTEEVSTMVQDLIASHLEGDKVSSG